jgi:hypothetical protein
MPSDIYSSNCTNSDVFSSDAGPAWMDAGFSLINAPDQQTVSLSWIQAGNGDGTGVSNQLENPELLRDGSAYLALDHAPSTDWDGPNATGFASYEAAPVCTRTNTAEYKHENVDKYS